MTNSLQARNIHSIAKSGATKIGTLAARNMLKKLPSSSVEVGEAAEASLRPPIRSGDSSRKIGKWTTPEHSDPLPDMVTMTNNFKRSLLAGFNDN
jgi:hypothetical protein